MADPGNMRLVEDLRSMTGLEIRTAVGIPEEIRRAINMRYRVSSEIEREVGRAFPSQLVAPAQPEREALDLQLSQAPIVRTADLLLAQAVRDRASDIHLEAEEDSLRVRMRIDGVLHEAMRLPKDVHAPLVSPCKMAEEHAERRGRRTCQISTQVEGKLVDLRAATSDLSHGEMMVLRVLDKSVSLMLRDLASPVALDRYVRLLRSPFGMVVAGRRVGQRRRCTPR
jgi:type IV pilus assembly protein PilB